MISRFFLLFIFLTASPLYAQTDSVTTALDIVEDFYAVTEKQTGGLDGGEALQKFRKRALEEKEKTTGELRALKWSEKPGTRRFNQVHKIVDAYTGSQIEAVRGLKTDLPAEETSIDEAVKKLTELKASGLKELSGTLETETYEKKGDKPVPIIDRSPFETEPDKDGGIWYR